MPLFLLLIACTPSGDEPGGPPATATLVLTDENTYDLDVSLDIPQLAVASRADLQVQWDHLAIDVWGEALGDRQVGRVLLVGLTGSPEEVAETFAAWEMGATDVVTHVALDLDPGRTSLLLSELLHLGNAWDPVESLHTEGWATTWWLILEQAHEADDDALRPLAWVALRPDDSAAATPVVFPESSGGITLTIELQPDGPLTVSRDATAWTVDCSTMTSASAAWLDGNTTTFVAHTAASVEEAEADLHSVVFDSNYAPALDGPGCLDGPVDLSTLVEQSTSEPFSGFSAGGTWFVGMRSRSPLVGEGLPVLGTVVRLE